MGGPKIFLWERRYGARTLVHIKRFKYPPGKNSVWHGHDYYECTLIERGSLRHVCEGREEILRAGQMVFLRPRDVHGLFCLEGASALTFSFARAPFESYRRRHRRSQPHWPWPSAGPPVVQAVTVRSSARLTEALSVLPSRGQTLTDLEWALGLILQCLRGGNEARPGESEPDWLPQALASYAARGDWTAGREDLVARAGRCPEHVGRLVRKHYGCTLTEMVNALRLDRAARLLSSTSTSIREAAWASGFHNLGHFYRCFRARFGLTPKAFRQKLEAEPIPKPESSRGLNP